MAYDSRGRRRERRDPDENYYEKRDTSITMRRGRGSTSDDNRGQYDSSRREMLSEELDRSYKKSDGKTTMYQKEIFQRKKGGEKDIMDRIKDLEIIMGKSFQLARKALNTMEDDINEDLGALNMTIGSIKDFERDLQKDLERSYVKIKSLQKLLCEIQARRAARAREQMDNCDSSDDYETVRTMKELKTINDGVNHSLKKVNMLLEKTGRGRSRGPRFDERELLSSTRRSRENKYDRERLYESLTQIGQGAKHLKRMLFEETRDS